MRWRVPAWVALAAIAVEVVQLADGSQPPSQGGHREPGLPVAADGQVGGDHRRRRRKPRHLMLGAVSLEVVQVETIAPAGVVGHVRSRGGHGQAQVLLAKLVGGGGVGPVRIAGMAFMSCLKRSGPCLT